WRPPMTSCPDCDRDEFPGVSRRQFVQTVGTAAAVAVAAPRVITAAASDQPKSETLGKTLYDTLTPDQKDEVCFDWDHVDDRGLLRMHVSNNWQITTKTLTSGFFTKDQQDIIETLYWGMYNPDWKDRLKKQLQDDAGGYGKAQSIAI